MSMFDMGAVTQNVKVVDGSYLKSGIHKVTFKGIEEATFEKDGVTNVVMDILFESPEGSYKHRLFAPTSSERTSVDRGGNVRENPSSVEQFMCTCRQIIDALSPEISEKINNGSIVFAAPDFKGFVKLMIKYTTPSIDKETSIKLLPNGQYVSFPRFPAQISKKGELYNSTKFIGEGLSLSSYEMGMIQRAAAATPTNMQHATEGSDISGDMLSKFQSGAEDDLPF